MTVVVSADNVESEVIEKLLNRQRSNSTSSRFAKLFSQSDNHDSHSASSTLEPMTSVPSQEQQQLHNNNSNNFTRSRCMSLPDLQSKPNSTAMNYRKPISDLSPTSIITQDGSVEQLYENDGWPNFKACALMQSQQRFVQAQIKYEEQLQFLYSSSPLNDKGRPAAVGNNNTTTRRMRPRGGSCGSLLHANSSIFQNANNRRGSFSGGGGHASMQQQSSTLYRYALQRGSDARLMQAAQMHSSYPTPRSSPPVSVSPDHNMNGGEMIDGSVYKCFGFEVCGRGSPIERRSAVSLPCSPMKN